MEEKKKKKKGAYGKVLGFCVLAGGIAAVLAWLGSGGLGFGGGGGFGLPWGQGNGNSSGGDSYNGNGAYYSSPGGDYQDINGDGVSENNNQSDVNETGNNEASEYEGGANEAPPLLVISVVGNTIFHGDDEITIDEMVRLFDDINQPGFTWELRDEQAIMETFETVRTLMLENGVYYTVR